MRDHVISELEFGIRMDQAEVAQLSLDVFDKLLVALVGCAGNDDEVHATLVYAEVLLQLDRSEDLWPSVEQVQALLLNRWKNNVGCCRGQVDQEVHSHDHR